MAGISTVSARPSLDGTNRELPEDETAHLQQTGFPEPKALMRKSTSTPGYLANKAKHVRLSGEASTTSKPRKPEPASRSMDAASRLAFGDVRVGDLVKVKYARSGKEGEQLFDAKILAIDPVEQKFRIHYLNWNRRYDAWVELDKISQLLNGHNPSRKRRKISATCDESSLSTTSANTLEESPDAEESTNLYGQKANRLSELVVKLTKKTSEAEKSAPEPAPTPSKKATATRKRTVRSTEPDKDEANAAAQNLDIGPTADDHSAKRVKASGPVRKRARPAGSTERKSEDEKSFAILSIFSSPATGNTYCEVQTKTAAGLVQIRMENIDEVRRANSSQLVDFLLEEVKEKPRKPEN